MKSNTSLINRVLRAHIRPVLQSSGFDRIGDRSSWRFLPDCIWVVKTRAVGAYFSSVTGWPPSSLVVDLAVFYRFVVRGRYPRQDAEGRLLPEEYECDVRTGLNRHLDQEGLVETFENPGDRRRKDIWWVHQDGSNACEVAKDIAHVIEANGKPWLERFTNLESALVQVEGHRDCYSKFCLAEALAEKLGLEEKRETYERLLKGEADRLGLEVTYCAGLFL